MLICFLGLFRPLFVGGILKKKKDETDNYYTCVALRAAGKNNFYELSYCISFQAGKF